MLDQLQGLLQSIVVTLLLVMAIALVLAIVGLVLLWRSLRRLDIPPDADYFTTMRHLPFLFTIVLDLLDFGLDIFAAPIVWIILDRLGMRGLRNRAALEAIIPFTQPIPTFTLSWVVARLFDLGDPPQPAYWRPVIDIEHDR